MEQLKLRFATDDDKPQLLEWLKQTPEFDETIMEYPTLQVLCAHNGAAVSYLPVQRVLMLESVGNSPDSSDSDKAIALRDLVKGSELIASSHKIREIYFLATDDKVAKIAEGHGFERLPWPVLRMKL